MKSALRRAFARSEIHKEAQATNRVEHEDPQHPRCEKWSWCSKCGLVLPTWRTSVDHVLPVVPISKRLEDMTPEEIMQRMWLCGKDNLQNLCDPCHNRKSKAENSLRPKRKSKKKG